MKKTLIVLSTIICVLTTQAQVARKLEKAWMAFQSDSQLRAASLSLYVVDAATGKPVFARNEKQGLATASTMKVITAATAYELLSRAFRYRTEFFVAPGATPKDDVLVVRPSGDPTLGSWRWKETREEKVVQRILAALRSKGFKGVTSVVLDTTGWQAESIPDGWTWQDIGNYYGAGSNALNWRENQYDLLLRSSGKQLGEAAEIIGTRPHLYGISMLSFVRVAAKETGDNTYIYYATDRSTDKGMPVHARGTIPAGSDSFVVSGAFFDPWMQFRATLSDSLQIKSVMPGAGSYFNPRLTGAKLQQFHAEVSPPLDSMVYWFLKKSINLYGESLLRTMGGTSGAATTAEGVAAVQAFWKQKGIDVAELNMMDGSGLSPSNRVSTRAQVQVLQYARKQPWFPGYFHAFPEYNGMKMKSGTINDVKGFCGYHTSSDGRTYTFSFLINNYNGSSSAIVQKMYKVLDALK